MYERPELHLTTLGRNLFRAPEAYLITAPLTVTAAVGLWAGLGKGLARLRAALSPERWRERRLTRKTIVAMAGLDDRILKDIGVSRSEIPHLARSLARDAVARDQRGPSRGFPVEACEAGC